MESLKLKECRPYQAKSCELYGDSVNSFSCKEAVVEPLDLSLKNQIDSSPNIRGQLQGTDHRLKEQSTDFALDLRVTSTDKLKTSHQLTIDRSQNFLSALKLQKVSASSNHQKNTTERSPGMQHCKYCNFITFLVQSLRHYRY